MVVEIRAAWWAVKVGRPEWIVPYGTTSSQGTAVAANRTATDGGHRGCGATMSTTPANRRLQMQDRRGDEISGGAMPANRGQGWTIESYAVAHERTAGPTAGLTTLTRHRCMRPTRETVRRPSCTVSDWAPTPPNIPLKGLQTSTHAWTREEVGRVRCHTC